MFLAINKDGKEWIYEEKPVRHSWFWDYEDKVNFIEVPKGTIQRLLNYPLTWDDDCQEIVEYKDNILKEFKVIKQNIKMRVTPEQSKKVQEICFANGVYWIVGRNIIQRENKKYLYLSDNYITFGDTYEYFEEHDAKEIDAALFIRTNGTCEEAELLLSKMIDFKDEEYTKLEKKVFNLRKQLEKYVIKIDNQKEELARLLSQKEELQSQLNMANKTVGISTNNGIDLVKYLEEKDAIIKYLESKLYN